MELRILDREDARAYREIHLEALADSPESFGGNLEVERSMPLGEIAAALRPAPNSFVMGAFDEDRNLVGITGFGQSDVGTPAGHGVLWGMYVRKESRREGIGAALLACVIATASSLDAIRAIRLRVVSGNTAAVALYRSAGFRITGVEREAFVLADRSYDEIWMELPLR